MFTPILTFEYDDINKYIVTLLEDTISFGVLSYQTDFHTLDEESDILSFTALVDNDLSYIIEEIAPDNVNFV